MNAVDCTGRGNELYTRQTKKLKVRLEITRIVRNTSVSIKLKPNQITTVISFMEAMKLRSEKSTTNNVIQTDVGQKKIVFEYIAGTSNMEITITDYTETNEYFAKSITVTLSEEVTAVFLQTLYSTYYKALQQGKL